MLKRSTNYLKNEEDLKKYREEQQQVERAEQARLQQQRQSVVFKNNSLYNSEPTRASVGIKLQQAMAKKQNNDLDLQETYKKNFSPSKISPAKYKDTGKKYGDYYHENYEQYKDMPIYERDDGTYYLKTKNGYQKVGKLNKEGIVDKNIEKVDKKLDKESLEKAKKLGFNGSSVQKMTDKERDRYWDSIDELQKKYKLSDKEYEDLWHENKVPSRVKKDDVSLKNVLKLSEKYNSQINDEYKDVDIQDRIFLDTFKGSEKERRQVIDFLANTDFSEAWAEKQKNAKWFKRGEGNLFEQAAATRANVLQKLTEGMGNFVEKIGDFMTEPITWLEAIGNTKDVTTTHIGQKQFDHDLTQYEYRGKKYWYDPEAHKLYEDGTHKEIKRFNINVMKKAVGHDNALANLGQAARETMTQNDTKDLFEDNAIDKWIQKNTVLGSNVQGGIESAGEMLPLMATGLATGSVANGVIGETLKSKATTNALVFAQSYSGTKTEALRQGMSVEDATKSAFVQAAAETISENFFDKIPGLSSAGWGDEIINQIAGKFEQKLGSKAGRLMYHALSQSGEGLEEIISNGLSTMGNEIVGYFDKNYASHFPELTGDMSRDMMNSMLSTESFDAFITATFTSMIMNSGSTILNNKQKNEIVKDFAETNGLTTKEAKIILKQNLSEELSNYTPTGKFEDRLNAEENATSKILGKMITNSIENHIELSDDGQSVRFYNKDLNYDEVNEKINYLTEMITTVDDYDLKINLLEAASKLEIAKNMMDEQLSTLDSSLEEEVEEKVEEKVEDAKTEEIAPTEEQDTEVQEEEKVFEEEKNKKIVQLNTQLEELRKTKNKQVQNLQLDKRISSQREGIEQIKDKIKREKAIFGFVDESRMKQLENAEKRLQDLLKQKKEPQEIEGDITKQINTIKKEIENVENTTFKKENKIVEETKEETTEKNTINEKIEKTDEKITVKPNEKNIRSWAETASKGDYKGVDLVKEVSDKIDHMYVPEHNVPHWNKALNRVEKDGYKVSFNYLKSKIDNNEKITLDDVMLGEKLLSEAAKNKNYEDVTYLLTELEILGTEMGQNIQALSVIRRLSPEGQLRILQRTISRMKSKGIKGAEDLHLTNDMVNLIENSTEEDLNKNVDSVKKLLGEQMTGTLEEKLRAWRYFAMLGNFKTHIRNIVSNVGMMGTRFLKKIHQRALESAVAKINPNAIPERRISFKKTSQDVKDYIDNYIKNNISLLSKESKYKVESQIEQHKKIFGNSIPGKWANKATEVNSHLLENEDLFFKLPAFKNAVGEFLVANGINTVEDIETHQKMFNKAVSYGVDEALKATFQQYSALAAALNTLGKKNKATQFISEALMPFKRTPINIVKTGVSYSPLGLLKTVTKNSMDLKKGKISVNEYIDNLSQGLTGTELMMVGFVLSKMGILSGKAGDSDKEGLFKKAQGKQDYSINIGNFSWNIDWLIPTSIPLLLGVTMNEVRNENTSMNMNTIMPLMTSVADPIIELSFLQTLDNALTTYGKEGLQGSVEDTVQSYIGQYVPTLLGQLAKGVDPTIRSTGASKNSSWKWGEETLRQLMNKIPGLTYALEPSVDMWGNKTRRLDGHPIINFFDGLFDPGTPKIKATDSVNTEIQNIYDQTHEDSVIPKLPSTYYYGLKKDVTYKGEKYASNAKEYTKMKETYGKTAYDTLKKLFKTSTYKNSSDEEKVKLIEKAYTHAADTMKKEFLSKKGVDYKNKTGYFFYKKLDEPVYEENAIKYVAEHDVDLSTAYKANKKKS